MKELLLIGLGGALGALSRYGFGQFTSRYYLGHFPLGTWLINVLGSFFIGILFVLIVERVKIHADYRLVFMVGFLGAFTTFSSFSLETINLMMNGRIFTALFYVLASVMVCLLATWLGIVLGRVI
jgi:CrcB protein